LFLYGKGSCHISLCAIIGKRLPAVSSNISSPPASFVSLTFFRTSFQLRYDLSRHTLTLSWRIRNIKSSAERYRDPRRLALATDCDS
jgi:hypothetical protein